MQSDNRWTIRVTGYRHREMGLELGKIGELGEGTKFRGKEWIETAQDGKWGKGFSLHFNSD